jgi:predicted DNA-binding protein
MYIQMPRVSKPMKLITLRIDEEEKARLEQLAERGNVTLSRALREGAALYLYSAQGRLHRVRGGDTTFHGVRRDKLGRARNKRSSPTKTERARLNSLSVKLYEHGLGSIRQAWNDGVEPAIVLASVGQWLSLVGYIYVSSADEIGWDWFLRDYCGFATAESSEAARREIRAALLRPVDVDVSTLLDTLEAGFRRLMGDAEQQELVRRAVLPTWHVVEQNL